MVRKAKKVLESTQIKKYNQEQQKQDVFVKYIYLSRNNCNPRPPKKTKNPKHYTLSVQTLI